MAWWSGRRLTADANRVLTFLQWLYLSDVQDNSNGEILLRNGRACDHLEANPTSNLHNNGILDFNKFDVTCRQCRPGASLRTSSAHEAISLFQSHASTVLKKSLF